MASMSQVHYIVITIVSTILALLLRDPPAVPFSGTPVLPLSAQDIVVPSSFDDKFAITTRMTANNTVRVLQGKIDGPEHVAMKPSSKQPGPSDRWELWTAAKNGSVYSVSFQGSKPDAASVRERVFAGPGRPLGFDWDKSGGMYIANSLMGLMYWQEAPKGPTKLQLVSSRVSASSALHPGQHLRLVDFVAVARASGKVYFTAATEIPPPYEPSGLYDPLRSALLEGLSGAQSGMLLEYDPSTGSTRCLMDGLWFSNGVAVAADGSFVLVIETLKLRVWRLWLAGPQAGQREVVLDKLPGWPDNLHHLPDTDTFWVALVVRPARLMTSQLYRSKHLRALAACMPGAWIGRGMRPVAGGIEFDRDGKVLQVVADPQGNAVRSTPSAIVLRQQHKVIMGNLDHDYLTVTSL